MYAFRPHAPIFFGGGILVSLYFGLPGAGKTTLAVKHILEARQLGMNVFTNIDVKIDGVFRVDRDDLGRYNIYMIMTMK